MPKKQIEKSSGVKYCICAILDSDLGHFNSSSGILSPEISFSLIRRGLVFLESLSLRNWIISIGGDYVSNSESLGSVSIKGEFSLRRVSEVGGSE